MLMLPSGLAPNNLHLRPTVKATFVESDVYDICHRLAAVSPRLHLWQLEEEGVDYPAWVVTEDVWGVEHLVKRYHELGAHMIEDVQRMLRIPLEVRAQVAEAEIAAADEAEKQRRIDEMYEEVGQKFWNRLERDGFTQRGVSYHKSYRKQAAGRG